MKKKVADILYHKTRVVRYRCDSCLLVTRTKLILAGRQAPETEEEYCPTCRTDTTFKIEQTFQKVSK